MKAAQNWGTAAYLALLIERISQAVQPRPRPAFNQVQFRPFDGARRVLSLEVAYYPARGQGGYVLIPRDAYFQQAEEVLGQL